jgi:hypothetical protein
MLGYPLLVRNIQHDPSIVRRSFGAATRLEAATLAHVRLQVFAGRGAVKDQSESRALEWAVRAKRASTAVPLSSLLGPQPSLSLLLRGTASQPAGEQPGSLRLGKLQIRYLAVHDGIRCFPS